MITVGSPKRDDAAALFPFLAEHLPGRWLRPLMLGVRLHHVEEIIFDAKEAARGIYVRPQPSLPFGAAVITIHRGEVLPGAWEEDCFVYPANQHDLAAETARVVSEHFPAIDIGTPNLRVFACPQALADKFDWDWSKSRDEV